MPDPLQPVSFNEINTLDGIDIQQTVQQQLDAISAVGEAALPAASFTDVAVTSKLLTDLEAGAAEAIAETDTILEALAKLQAQIDAL